MKKDKLVFAIFLLFSLYLQAQEKTSVFNFLKIPLSAHTAALGGENVSLASDDPSLIFGNPAQASQVNNKSINIDYVSYLKDTKIMGAAYTQVFSVRHTFGATAQVMDYGSMTETDEHGNQMGSFSAKDIAISALYSYTMGNGWSGGATLRYIASKYAEYSSTAIGVDMGLLYTNDAKDFSFGVVMKNIGSQLSSFHDNTYEHLPFDLQMGITRQLEHAPFRISVTLRDLTRWSNDYYYNPEKKNGLGRKLFNHAVFGVDFLPSDKLYFSLGLNCRRSNELKAMGSSRGAGWSFGGGVNLNKIKVGVAYAKYHVSTSSLVLNASYSL